MQHVTAMGNLVIKTNSGEQVIVNLMPGTKNLIRVTTTLLVNGKAVTSQETYRTSDMGFERNEPFERGEPTHRLVNASEMVRVFSGSESECQEMLANVNDPDEHYIETINNA